MLSNAALDGIVPPFRGQRAMQMTVSGSILDDPKYWLERAEEVRSIADQLSDPDSRRMMLWIAEGYERSQITPRAGMAARHRAETRSDLPSGCAAQAGRGVGARSALNYAKRARPGQRRVWSIH